MKKYYSMTIWHDAKPIHSRHFDWCCSLDDDETVNAHGESPEAAVDNFVFVFESYLDRQDELDKAQEKLERAADEGFDKAKVIRRGEL
jgi:hypothetical protein